MGFGRTLTNISAYVKPESSLITRTLHGGVVTLAGFLLATILVLSEIYQFIYATPTYELMASTERHALLPIHLDISFPNLPCALLSVDMIDEAGEVVSDDGSTGMKLSGVESMQLHKQRLAPTGRLQSAKDYKLPAPDMIAVVGGMLVSESSEHIKDMDNELQAGEGCHVYGDIRVRRIEGIIRFSVHLKDYMMMASTRKSLENQIRNEFQKMQQNHGVGLMDIHPDYTPVNVSHHIHKIQFGPGYWGRYSPLNGLDRVVTHDYGTYRYFLTIVPTTFVSALYARTKTYLYSVTEYFVPGAMDRQKKEDDMNVERMPAVDFRIRMSPLSTKVWYDQRQVFHFVTRMSAVLGGCVAITQWADTVVHAIMKYM